MFVCQQNDVCENYIGSVYVGGQYGLSKNQLCVFVKLCLVGFLAMVKCLSGVLQYIVMSYVVCGDDGYVVR